MIEKSATRRVADRLGGAPGWFVVYSVVLGAIWFPFRLYLDRGDPLPAVITVSALYGVIWAALIPVFERLSGAAARPAGDEARRRGAYLGLAVGIPYYGALMVLCLSTGRSWVWTAGFAVVLAAVVVIALRRLR